MDHDYNDVAAITEPETPPLLEAAETIDPLNINAHLQHVPSQYQEQPPPQQSSSSFAAGVIQDLHNLDQSLGSRNTFFTPYHQSFSQFRSYLEHIGSSHETRNVNAHLQPGPSQSHQISSFEQANVHSLVAYWPNRQQLSSNQPSWHQNHFNMGYFHPGSASYPIEVQPPSLSVAAPYQPSSSSYQHGLATSHVLPVEQHPSMMQPFATREEAKAYRDEAKRKYLLRKSRRKSTKPFQHKIRSDEAK